LGSKHLFNSMPKSNYVLNAMNMRESFSRERLKEVGHENLVPRKQGSVRRIWRHLCWLIFVSRCVVVHQFFQWRCSQIDERAPTQGATAGMEGRCDLGM
jgi:hypothetical protein